MTKNLDLTMFRNGDSIPQAITDAEWKRACENKQPAWCFYDNDPVNGAKYGKLYNWYAVNDPRGLAPEGWKVPSDEDWQDLTGYLGGASVAGKKLKHTNFWAYDEDKTGNGTNTSGFFGLPGGNRNPKGPFYSISKNGIWWSPSEYNKGNVWTRVLSHYTDLLISYSFDKAEGLSVRCIMN